ncbi:MAG: hypothetical protein RIT14_123 [Pseudomonadota bacterium]
MSLRAAALAALMALAAPGALRADVAGQAAQAAEDLQRAVVGLQAATGARDRVAALTETIRAYEAGLAALRAALRQVALHEADLSARLAADQARIGRLLAVLVQIGSEPGPVQLLHPSGPLGTARAGMVLAEMTPALQAEVAALSAELQELRALRALQEAAGQTLMQGLAAAEAARTALSQAMSDRRALPRRFTEDPAVLRGLLESADTLDALAAGLDPGIGEGAEFATARGRLPWPVAGRVVLRAGEADATGARKPGLTLAVPAQALVTAPWDATIRYAGPFPDYGNVMILEPGDGYLLVLAGLGTVYGEIGEVVAAGAPLGLMGGAEPAHADLAAASEDGGGTGDAETLYLEIRQGAEPVNPEDWFTAARD